MTVRTVARAALLVLLLGTVIVPGTRAADPRTIGWILTRTESGPAPIEGHLRVTGTSAESAIVMFALSGERTHRRLDYRFVTTTVDTGGDAWVRVHDDHVDDGGCPAACETPVALPNGISVTSNDRPIASTVYIAAHDVRDPTLDITSPGWKVRRWTPGWRSLTRATADGTSVSTMHYGIGTYRGGSLPGGRYGSFVWTAIPCGSRGRGEAALTGGTRRLEMACDGYHTAVDALTRATTWRVTGEVTGDGWESTVVIVVDYPA